jgi:hypothetical protein
MRLFTLSMPIIALAAVLALGLGQQLDRSGASPMITYPPRYATIYWLRSESVATSQARGPVLARYWVGRNLSKSP